MAHSITLVALFSSTWTSEVSDSSGRRAASFADLTEKRVPATLADSLADCELDSHDTALGWPNRTGLTLFGGFLLFNVVETQMLRAAQIAITWNQV